MQRSYVNFMHFLNLGKNEKLSLPYPTGFSPATRTWFTSPSCLVAASFRIVLKKQTEAHNKETHLAFKINLVK